MTRILSYRKVIDEFTTHSLREPDYDLDGLAERITELCTIDGVTYVAIPDSVVLPLQPVEITLVDADLSDPDLVVQIKEMSPHVKLVNKRVVDIIRRRYSVDDEIKMLRLAPSDESSAYNDYVEECRAWGREEKEKLGL